MPRRLPAVLFDLDGTLLDSASFILESTRHAFAGHEGLVPSDEEWLGMMGTPLAAMFGRYTSDADRVQALIVRYREHQHANLERLTRCFDGVTETVRALYEAGHPMGIVTSKGVPVTMKSLALVGLAPYMEVIVGLESCARHKPHPEPVRTALDQLGLAPREAIFVGDSPFDMEAGRAAGTWTAAALWGPFSRAQLEPTRPDFWLARITELPAVVEGLGPR